MSISAPVLIELSEDERAQLESWARRHTSAQALALRSRVVLLAAEGLNNTEIARRLGVHRPMVRKWRGRFAEHRLDGLTDEPRPGQPRTVTDEQVEEVIVKTLESTPRDATHWSTRSMAKCSGSEVRRRIRGQAAWTVGWSSRWARRSRSWRVNFHWNGAAICS